MEAFPFKYIALPGNHGSLSQTIVDQALRALEYLHNCPPPTYREHTRSWRTIVLKTKWYCIPRSNSPSATHSWCPQGRCSENNHTVERSNPETAKLPIQICCSFRHTVIKVRSLEFWFFNDIYMDTSICIHSSSCMDSACCTCKRSASGAFATKLQSDGIAHSAEDAAWRSDTQRTSKKVFDRVSHRHFCRHQYRSYRSFEPMPGSKLTALSVVFSGVVWCWRWTQINQMTQALLNTNHWLNRTLKLSAWNMANLRA